MDRRGLIRILVFASLGLAIALRFIGLGDLTLFEGDQAFDCSHLASIVGLQDPPRQAEYWALGPYSGIGGFYGPLFYYLLALPFWLAGGDPAVGAWVVAVLNLFTILLVYRLARVAFDPATAGIAVVLFSTSSAVIYFARFMWSPNLIPLFSVAVCLAFVTLRRESAASHYLGLGVLLGCYVQLHAVTWGVAPFVALYLTLFRQRYRASGLVLAAAGALIALAPWLWREAMFVVRGSQVSLIATVMRSWIAPRDLAVDETLGAYATALDWLIGLPAASWIGPVVVLGLGAPALMLALVNGTTERALVATYFVCNALFVFLAPQQVYRLQGLFPFLLLFVAAGLSVLWRAGHPVLVVVAVALLSVSSVRATWRDIGEARRDHPGTPWATLGDKLRVAERIVADADHRQARIEMTGAKSTVVQPADYRYLLQYLVGSTKSATEGERTYWIVRAHLPLASELRQRPGMALVAQVDETLVFRRQDGGPD